MRTHIVASGLALGVSLLVGSAVVATQEGRRGATPPRGAARVTFTETIAPILYANCVTCHRPGEAAPFSLISYEDAAKRAELIAEVTLSRYMPPWHAAHGFGEFVGERRLTEAQIAAIGTWVSAGMPRGDLSRMPKPPAFPADGWRLGQPDLILEMPAGFDLPASGPDVFRNFVIPTRLTEDKWVKAVDFRPSARPVVHHALFAAVAGGSLAARDGADGRPGFGGMGAAGAVSDRAETRGLGGWAVGATPRFLPEGIALRMAKGSDFLLQLHFHLSGKPETEKSLIGIYFADKAPEKHLMSVQLPALFGFGAGIDIPPGERQYTIKDSFTVPGDVRVFLANAHAHYLAKEMKATATLPDGSTRPLIWIDDWDFNWQDSYTYKTPVMLPKGSRIDVTISYDNSTTNPRNPISPPRRALWGEQSFDEMGMVGFGFEVMNKTDTPAFEAALGERNKMAIMDGGRNGTLGRFLARQKRQSRGIQQLTIFDRQGNVVSRVGEPGAYAQAAFSPDGARLAVIKGDPDNDTQDVWTFDVASGKGTSVTTDDAPDSAPVWSPDGQQIAYVSIRDNTHGIYRRAADGKGAEERLYQHSTGAPVVLTDWSADGRFLCFWSGDTMYVLPLAGDRQVIALKGEELVGRGGRFSPDTRFLAFSSNQPGRFQVYRKAFDPSPTTPDVGNRSQISSEGGIGGIVWRRDGKELFYFSLPPRATVMSVELASGPDAQPGTPQRLFEVPTGTGGPAQLSAIASPDGQRFVFTVAVPTKQQAVK
jgi:Tol biopolymer transport system component/mono/diheme cytochrome c family protein